MRIEDKLASDYKYGFVTDIESEEFPKGLSEEIVRMISAKKNEPEWLLEYRLKAYRHWLTLEHNVSTVKFRPLIFRIFITTQNQNQKKTFISH